MGNVFNISGILHGKAKQDVGVNVGKKRRHLQNISYIRPLF